MNSPEQTALDLLQENRVDGPPTPIEQLARAAGAELRFVPFDSAVSGMLYRVPGKCIIGVNSFHPYSRQRFTVAHELGHLKLHDPKKLFLDRSVQVHMRDERSGLGTEKEEIEANAFAAELLMPRDLIYRELGKIVSTDDPRADISVVENLARVFKVSTQAMAFRLANLGVYLPQ